jgi:hypothetical protein
MDHQHLLRLLPLQSIQVAAEVALETVKVVRVVPAL